MLKLLNFNVKLLLTFQVSKNYRFVLIYNVPYEVIFAIAVNKCSNTVNKYPRERSVTAMRQSTDH